MWGAEEEPADHGKKPGRRESQRAAVGRETLGEARAKPDVGRCEVIDDGETSFSFSTNTVTGNLPWGRLSKWQVVESGGFRRKQM